MRSRFVRWKDPSSSKDIHWFGEDVIIDQPRIDSKDSHQKNNVAATECCIKKLPMMQKKEK